MIGRKKQSRKMGKRNRERKDVDIREEENVNYWKSLIGNLLEQIKKIKRSLLHSWMVRFIDFPF
jgi:hypothetical protein